MGESIVDSSSFGDKKQIEKISSSSAALEVSVSFGRFENDSLSWERFSTFSPNKYLEEVEKCATPGSVAEKRAYFEAHYRKIAAKKAELMDLEKTQDSAEAAEEEPNWVSEVSNIHIDEEDEDASIVIECQSSVFGVKDESDCRAESPNFDGSEEVGIVGEEGSEVVLAIESKDTKEEHRIESKDTRDEHTIECKGTKGLPQNLEGKTGNVKKTKDQNVKSDRPKSTRKITTVSKEKGTPGVKKKPASPIITKMPQFSAPRTSKPAPIRAQQVSTPTLSKSAPAKTSKSTPQFSTPRVSKPAPTALMKKENGASVPRKTSPSGGEGKRVTPKSLHMSLRIDPATTPVHSDPASLTTARKSLIMERMGDKDIVKRAFKSFQNNFNQLRSLSEERESVLEQASTTGTDVVKVSGTVNTRKENGGSIRVSATEKRSAKVAPSFGLKSNERAPKHKEFSKKLEEKSNTQTERTRAQPKSKEQKEAETKRLTQSLDLKAAPMSGLYPGKKKVSTGPSH